MAKGKVNIRGNVVSLDELKADVRAARQKRIEPFAFTSDTVEALIAPVEFYEDMNEVRVLSIVEDFLNNPRFDQRERVHDWRTWIDANVQKIWNDLPLEMKFLAFCKAHEQADAEEWD